MTKKQSSTILKDVVAFVDVWSTSKRENYSEGFMQQLIEMGAEVSRTLNKNVTHVIFKHGHQSTWKKAQKMGVKIVTVLWVDRCRSEGKHVNENLCPAVNEDSKSVIVNKRTHKCMQPRDIPMRTPENDRRLKKKLDKMMLNLTPSSPIVTDMSPLIIDEEHGIVYSPSSRRAETMALRLQQMKEGRENLSPTASQMVDSTFTHDRSQKASFRSSPSTSYLQLLGEDDSTSHHGHTPDLEAAQGSHYMSASKSDSSALSITPSEEKNHHRKTWELSASTPLSGDAPKRRSSRETVASVTDSKAALPPKRKGLSKTAAKRSTANQNSLDSYFSTAVPKGKWTVMVDDNVNSDVESRLKLTPPKDGTLIEDTEINASPTFNETRAKTNKRGSSHIHTCTSPILSMSTECERRTSTLVPSPTFNETRTKTNKRGSSHIQTCASPILSMSTKCERKTSTLVPSPTFNETQTKTNKRGSSHIQTCTSPILSMSTECEGKTSTLVSSSSLPKACSLKKTSLTAVSKLKKVAKSSFSPSLYGGGDVFEDYFSSTEKPTRQKRLSLDISPEKDPFSQFEPSAKPAKRKRRKSESVGSSKRQKQAPVSAAEFFGEPAGLSSPCEDVASLLPKPRSYGRGKSTHKQPASSGKDKEPRAVTDGSERAGDKDDARQEQLTLTFPKPPLTSRLNEAGSRKGSQTLSEGIKYAPDGLRDTSTEMFSCQGGEKDTNVKTKRTLVMTSMPTENQHTVLQLVQTLGGFSVVDTVCESTTHVVSGSPRRTLNVLLGIARGCWILSYEWILWSLEHRQWIPEEPYELSDHFPAAPICRLQQHLSAGEHQQDLFQSLPVMFVSPLAQPPPHSLEELIRLCGGAVCRTIRQAGICIGEYRGRKPEGTRCLSEQWILDSVTHLKRLPYEDYDLDDQYR